MPNWVTNVLEIHGSEEMIAKARDFILTPVEEHDLDDWGTTRHIEAHDAVDFERLVPMPEIVHTIRSGSCDIDGEQVNHWVIEVDGNRKLTEEEQDFINTFGDWYTWSCHNWGCKWNACDSSVQEDTSQCLVVKFDTPWSAPLGWLVSLVHEFLSEEILIRLSFADEDFGNNTGIIQYSGTDEEIRTTIFVNSSLQSYAHAAELKGYDPRVEYPDEWEDVELDDEAPMVQVERLGKDYIGVLLT